MPMEQGQDETTCDTCGKLLFPEAGRRCLTEVILERQGDQLVMRKLPGRTVRFHVACGPPPDYQKERTVVTADELELIERAIDMKMNPSSISARTGYEAVLAKVVHARQLALERHEAWRALQKARFG